MDERLKLKLKLKLGFIDVQRPATMSKCCSGVVDFGGREEHSVTIEAGSGWSCTGTGTGTGGVADVGLDGVGVLNCVLYGCME